MLRGGFASVAADCGRGGEGRTGVRFLMGDGGAGWGGFDEGCGIFGKGCGG